MVVVEVSESSRQPFVVKSSRISTATATTSGGGSSVITKPSGFVHESIRVVPDEEFRVAAVGSRDRLKATSTPNDDVSVQDVFPPPPVPPTSTQPDD